MKARRSRRRSRGFSNVSTVLESAMVMGWFVVLVLGEKAVSDAASARRAVEDATQRTATASSGAYCLESAVDAAGGLGARASIVPSGKLDVQRAVAAIVGLGLGGQRTFANYVLPLLDVRVTASREANGHVFTAQRTLGCLERPLDTPAGSLPQYFQSVWMTNLMGY